MTVALAAAALLGITVWRAALENGAQEEKKTSLRIGVLLYRGDDTFIGTLRSSMEQDAKECFKQGLNCSECVMTAFLNHFDTGLPKEVVKLATGFGGGMGHTKNTCGAITGAVMALSAIVGRENPAAKETVGERITELQQGIYPIVGKMVNEIKDEYGTLICSELSNPFGDFACKERKKNCMTMIMHCANLAAKYAEEAQK